MSRKPKTLTDEEITAELDKWLESKKMLPSDETDDEARAQLHQTALAMTSASSPDEYDAASAEFCDAVIAADPNLPRLRRLLGEENDGKNQA